MLRQRKPLFILLTGFVLLTMFLLSADLRAVQSQQVTPTAPEDYVYGDWQTAPNSPFAYSRFDAEYSQDTGMVYILGGRLPDGGTDGSVWEFDPVTGTYTDTGVDMPVPISNYQIAAVDDSGTEVFMVFGGRPAAGGVTDAVQGYIPSSNTTVNFTATDPYPVATSPGGSVTVDNLVYSFGGFDAVAVIPDTYIFDISASDGNRFSTGPDLNLGRSYIAATAVDGYIYAIGGDTFDGASLIPQTIAERLDTSNPVAWDDASVADLPIACEATPAFGFEPGSDYDLAGAIVLAGCGQWPNESVEAQIYDIASDTWDTAFHDLNEARRNHAGAFIPTGDGTGGFPGMWVWGGIQEADSNLLTIPEYYQVTPLDDFTLVPQEQFHAAFEAVTVNMGAANNSGGSDTFDLTYSDTEGWDITGPATVTVDDGDIVAFTIDVEIPDSADCLDTNVIIVEATGQGDPSLTDTATINIEVACPTGIQGVITDANTGLPLAGAYVYAEYTLDPAIVGEAFTNDEGEYFITEMAPGNYYVAVSAEGYQWSPLPEGWPNGTDLATVVDGELSELDVALNAPVMEWSDSSYTVTAPAGTVVTQTLTISNTGTSDLYVSIGNYDGSIEPPPAVTPARTPGYRIDSRILSHMEIDGTADFIVVMAEQADLSGA